MFTRILVRLDCSLLGVFSFTRCIPNTLDICLRWLLSRFRSGQSRGVRSWGFLWSVLFERAVRVSPPDFLGGLHSCFQVFVVFRLSGGFSGLFSSLVPNLSWGFSIILGWTALRLQAVSQEVLTLPSMIIVSWQRRSNRIFILALWRAYFDCRLSSYSVRKEILI